MSENGRAEIRNGGKQGDKKMLREGKKKRREGERKEIKRDSEGWTDRERENRKERRKRRKYREKGEKGRDDTLVK